MSEEFRQPTKKELQAKYGISNDDFDVLTSHQEPANNAEPTGDWFQRVPDWINFTTFLRWRGLRVVAVIIIVQTAYHGFRETVKGDWAGIKRAFEPFTQEKHLPADAYADFPLVGVTSNSVVTVVHTGTIDPTGPFGGLSNGSGNTGSVSITRGTV